MKKKVVKISIIISIGIACLSLLVAIFVLNKWIQNQIQSIDESQQRSIDSKFETLRAQNERLQKKKEFLNREVIRKTHLDPSRKFSQSIVYADDQEVARFKASGQGVVYDFEGDIPEGEVKFFNSTQKTYGKEKYRNNKRHGIAVTYFETGQLYRKAYYRRGRLLQQEEYYIDGTLRMEQDYEDARHYEDDNEVGIGKVYSRDGTIKYEWHLTRTDEIGFKKSYNSKGELILAIYYDTNGDEIRREAKEK